MSITTKYIVVSKIYFYYEFSGSSNLDLFKIFLRSILLVFSCIFFFFLFFLIVSFDCFSFNKRNLSNYFEYRDSFNYLPFYDSFVFIDCTFYFFLMRLCEVSLYPSFSITVEIKLF